MTNEKFDAWCREATKGIRYGPDRKAVYRELMDHLEERRDSLLAEGRSSTQATTSALESMGSAQEIAPQLAAVHRPWLGYILTALRFVTIPLCVFTAYYLIHLTVYFTIDWFRYAVQQEPTFHCQEDIHVHPNVFATSDGYRFQIVDVQMRCNSQILNFDLVITYWPWLDRPNITREIWAMDSNGNYYPCRSESEHLDIPKVTTSSGIISTCFEGNGMKIMDFDRTAQWVEFHYDRDGRDIVLHIDLTGGDGA